METPPPVPATPPPLLHQSGRTRDEVNMAMWCHLIPVLASVLGFGLFAFLGPLLIRQNNRSQSAFVDQHARESLNFQLSMLLYIAGLTIISIMGAIVTLGIAFFVFIPAIILVAIAGLVLEIIATVKATNGEHFDYKVSILFVK